VGGYLNGVKVNNVSPFTDTTSWQDITANFGDVDTVVFSGSFEMLDNITVNAATTVPEPASMALLGLGIVGTGIMGRRRRQAAG
jgi:hypothetical protein